MPDERTPLITTVRVAPVRRRYSHNVLRRFCTIALSSILIWFAVALLVVVIVSPPSRHDDGWDWDWDWPGCKRRHVTYEQLREFLIDTPSSEKIEDWSRYYTAGPHLAGQNYSQARWTREKWEEFGVKSDIVAYDVYLNRPVDHRLALLRKSKGSSSAAFKVAFEASLTEDVLHDDPTTGLENRVPTFHGYSASGNVTAPFVYVNYGTYQDYEDLVRANVSLKGKIAIARYGKIFRGLKVKRAQELGMVGAILYSDPGDDGEVTEENGVEPYPKGSARQPSSVQRGSASFLSILPGDPTTPGYPSKPGVPRGPTDGFTPSIPSIPISYADAIPILKALNGYGPQAKDINKYWTADIGLEYHGVDYNIGPSPDDVVLNLYNEQDYITTPLWNVIGIINGSIHDEVVIIGNHRDAWIAGGAVDPNSGSAVLNEVIRSFGRAVQKGWKPLRTIVFASWDGEEYNLIGSTEWVEEYLPWLSGTNAAYLNLDVSVRGPRFRAAAAPLLRNLLYNITGEVQSPNQTVKGQTVRDLWNEPIYTMGSGSDFTAFQDHAGVPCVDIGFDAAPGSPVYHYHSNYDSFHWVSTYGDPGFVYHRTMAQVLGLMTAKLADTPVLSLGAGDYAEALATYVKKVEDKLDAALSPSTADTATLPATEAEIIDLRASHRSSPSSSPRSGETSKTFRKSLRRLHKAVKTLSRAASALDSHAADLARRVQRPIPWWRWLSRVKLYLDLRRTNSKLKLLERHFLYEPGLDDREWFKHVVFAPGRWTGYAGAVFPGLMESIDSEDYDNAVRWAVIIENCILDAAKSL